MKGGRCYHDIELARGNCPGIKIRYDNFHFPIT